MIGACKERVRSILAGLTPPVPPTSLFLSKDGDAAQCALPKVVMLTGRDETKPDGMLVAIETDAKVRRYVTRRAIRRLQLGIFIYHRTEEEAEVLLQAVVAGLLDGLVADGRPVTGWTSDTQWVDEASWSRREAMAKAGIDLVGGVYRTRTVPLLTDIAVQGEVI